MSQEAPTVADAPHSSDGDVGTELTTTDSEALSPAGAADEGGVGASEGGFAIRFGSGFAVGMLIGGVAGVLLNSLPPAMFLGFIIGGAIGILLAARD